MLVCQKLKIEEKHQNNADWVYVLAVPGKPNKWPTGNISLWAVQKSCMKAALKMQKEVLHYVPGHM